MRRAPFEIIIRLRRPVPVTGAYKSFSAGPRVHRTLPQFRSSAALSRLEGGEQLLLGLRADARQRDEAGDLAHAVLGVRARPLEDIVGAQVEGLNAREG